MQSIQIIIINYQFQSMTRKVSEEQSQVVFIGQPQQEMIEVDFDLQERVITDIELTILDRKQQAGDIQWYIKVQENSKTNPQKAVSYEIKRKFSEVKWLIQVLREVGKIFILPLVGIDSGSIKTYYKTKLVKDNKTFEYRHEHLNRFLRKLCEHKQILNEKVFQIFISQQREEFQTFKKRYEEEHKSSNSGVVTQWVMSFIGSVSKVIPKFSTDSEMIIVYKEMFSPIERDVTTSYEAMTDILNSHNEYLVFLKEYDPNLISADEEYNASIERLVKWLELILEEIKENKDQVGRERSKEEHDRFKANFSGEIERYKKEIEDELKAIAKELSKANELSCGKISELFREKFTIQV